VQRNGEICKVKIKKLEVEFFCVCGDSVAKIKKVRGDTNLGIKKIVLVYNED